MFRKNNGKSGIVLSLVLSLIFIALTAYFVINRQQVVDTVNYLLYHPSSEVASIADRAGMGSGGKFLFYASQPKLDATSDFNKECDRVETSAAILGCYDGSRIYIYDVTDPQVDGVREVTSAHEMLHVAYARMDSGERKQIDQLLEEEYKKISGDADFAELIAFYSRTEPGQRDNELHSIVGTEVASLDKSLEDHYSKYFSTRQKVVTLDVKYKSVFKTNKAKADSLLAQYNSLSEKITAEITKYNSDVQILNNDIATFNNKAADGGFSSMAQFNSQRSVLMGRISALETERQNINNDIKTYQNIYNEYNQIATESKKLYGLLDSSLAPSPSL